MISVPDNPSRNGKLYSSGKDALEGISIGDTVLVAGFARCGIPQKLLQALSEIEVSELLKKHIPSAEMVRFGKNGADANSIGIKFFYEDIK